MPDVRQVNRPTSRHDEQGVDPDVVALTHITRGETLCGGDDPSQAVVIEREPRRILGRSRLDLHEGERPAALRDDVDFAAGHPRAPGEDAPALEAKVPAGERFRAAPAFFRCLAVQRIISRTRA